ncbi:hypothetical protein M569_07309 [Genlisea aurea]|uniref:Uncharacterized protein n=1 Tax=Genlisea aurea TaxID=192259 RepID=S8E546_9LAMI|nr:hypothetical protein M569_07309 [Genlisea aurea]
MGISKKLCPMGNGESEKWVFSGFSLRIPAKQVSTRVTEKRGCCELMTTEEDFPTTPTAAESRIPRRLACPPPPKKRKTKSLRCYGVREYFNPPDLESIFT